MQTWWKYLGAAASSADREDDEVLNSVGRRHWLQRGAVACLGWGALPAQAVQRAALNNPLRLGCDESLVGSGLAAAWQRGFAADTGVVIVPVPETAANVLDMLERGDFIMSMTNVPVQEMALEKRGLAHERAQVAVGGFVVVGPPAVAKAVRPAPPAKRRSGTPPPPPAPPLTVTMLMQVLATSQLPFLSRGDDSSTHRFEQGLWRQAQITPAAPWYLRAQGDTPVWLQARDAGACTVVERGVWARQGRASGLAVLAEGGADLSVPLHVMRSFRANHPATRLFSEWARSPRGRRVVNAHPGYSAPPVA